MKAPFTQLWSIHAFARVGSNLKQIPLVYALMSGKRKVDYQRILEVVQLELDKQDLTTSVEVAVCDFEPAVWRAFRLGIFICFTLLLAQ